MTDPLRRLAHSTARRLLTLGAMLPAGMADTTLRVGVRAAQVVWPGRGEAALSLFGVERARKVYQAGDVARARELVDELEAGYPPSTRVLLLRRDVVRHQGELSEVARTLHRIYRRTPTEEVAVTERIAMGRLIETSAGWLPRIEGPPQPVVPPDESVVLHLLKESAPELTNGFTMRSRYNLLAARDAGVRPVVVTSLGFPRDVGSEVFDPVADVDGIPHHRLDLGPFYPLAMPFDTILEHQAWLTARLARGVRPAVIHASSGRRGYETALVGIALRAHIARPLVYEVRSFFEATWSGDARWNESSEHYRRRYDTETRAMVAADHVVTIAESMRADILERGVDPARVTVIPNGVDAASFTPRPRDAALAKRLGIDGTFVFGYVSNLDHPRENQELLIRTAALLRGRGRRVSCLIVGDGGRRPQLQELARQAGVADIVVFTGSVAHDEVQAHYALMDAFVVPRRDDRAGRAVTPLKPYEALAMERPLVAADLPALAEIAGTDRGLLFPPDDEVALARDLERLMDDPALGQRLGRAGREWVARERSWASNGALFRDVYRDVLERWQATPEGAR